MKLSAEQKKFLCDYFSLSESDLKAMTKDDWHKIKMECRVIEGIEYEKAEINNSRVSDKGVIAEQLVDMDYSELLFIDHKNQREDLRVV